MLLTWILELDTFDQAERQVVDAEWDYRNDKLNWQRAMSFLPNWGRIWVRVDEVGDVLISYGTPR